MKIAEIKTNSTAEVKDHFADIIYFQGCEKGCPFCFNKEICDMNGGIEMTPNEVISKLSHFSDTVVFTGGDPLYQPELQTLIDKLSDKYLILETSFINKKIFSQVDKVLFSFKTFIPHVYHWKDLESLDNVDIVVVIGHRWFNKQNFRDLVSSYKKDIYIRYYNDKPCDIRDVLHIMKAYKKPCKVFRQLEL